MANLLSRADSAIGTICKVGALTCLVGLSILLGLAIVLRLLPLFTIPGYDEIVELAFIWLVMLTGVALWREGVLYRVVLFEVMLPHMGRKTVEVVINLAMLAFALMLVFYGYEFMELSGETTPYLRLDKRLWYCAIPICSALMAIYSVVWLWRVVRRDESLDSASTIVG